MVTIGQIAQQFAHQDSSLSVSTDTCPSRFLPPVILRTTAIAVTFYTSPRFAHTAVFFAVMTWIHHLIGAAVALVIGLRKSSSGS